MPEIKQRVGVIALLIKDNKILLGKRKNAYGSGKYGLPGGRAEFGEKLEDVFKRELMEEIGIKPIEYKFLGSIREDQAEFIFVHYVYNCTNFSGEIQTLEKDKCEGWDWYSKDNLPKNILEGHLAAIKMHEEGLRIIDLV